MKKIILLFAVMLFTASMAFAEVVYSEDCTDISDWTITNGADNEATITWENGDSGGRSLTGSSGAWLAADSDENGHGLWLQSTITSGTIDCTGYSNVHLKFIHYYRHYGSQFGKVHIIDSSKADNVVATYNSSSVNGDNVDIDVSAYADNDNSVQIAFEFDDNDSWDYYWLIDTITLEGTQAGAPDAPTNPSPADIATNVSITADIGWTFGADTTTYDLYFDLYLNKLEHQLA